MQSFQKQIGLLLKYQINHANFQIGVRVFNQKSIYNIEYLYFNIYVQILKHRLFECIDSYNITY